MRHDKDTIKQATSLISEMRRSKIHDFGPDVFGAKDRLTIQDMVRLAKVYCRIKDHDRNGTRTSAVLSAESSLEARIRGIAQRYELTVEFINDINGFIVSLHTLKRNVFNTWGEAKGGWQIN